MKNKLYIDGKTINIPKCLLDKKKKAKNTEEVKQNTSDNLCVPVVINGCKGFIINNTDIGKIKKLFGKSPYNTYFMDGTYIYKKKDYPKNILLNYRPNFNYIFMTKDSFTNMSNTHLDNILIYAGANLEDNEYKFLFTNDLSKVQAMKLSELHKLCNGDCETIFEKVSLL
jgi:hypothetical protein